MFASAVVRIICLALVSVFLWALFAGESGASGVGERYVVQPGDTLWSIAVRRGVGDPREGVWKIREANGLRDSSLEAGQVLLLPS